MKLKRAERPWWIGLGLSALAVSTALQAQDCPQLGPKALNGLAEHIRYLSSDDLAGRSPGTKGEQLAAEYISREFAEIGLVPAGVDHWYEPFQVADWAVVGQGNKLVVGGVEQTRMEQYYPTPFTHNGRAEGQTVYVKYGMVLEAKKRNDLKGKNLQGKIAVMDAGAPDGIHPHSEYAAEHDLLLRVQRLAEAGATAVLIVNKEGDQIPPKKFKKLRRSSVPVHFVADPAVAKKLKKKQTVQLSAKVEERFLDAVNIVGQIDNGAEYTVVIGAHYDHLGWGDEGSLHKGEPAIHNGADDNASGTAGVIELARWLKALPSPNHNYLFVCFSAEEMGLLGSNYFVKNLRLPTQNISYMINMDMIGRLSEDKGLAISGVGTSPAFADLAEKHACFEYPVKTSASGTGPSDHTSFYNQQVPVLHFFTGTHADYHKPTDDFEFINLEGTQRVLEHIAFWIAALEETPRLEFTPTKDASSDKAPRFSVTLGVVPDYLFSGEGMRIDGVTEGKPASKAGLKTGDVVLQIGDHKVVDMMSYMNALSAFKAGDHAELTYERSGEAQKTTVRF